MTYREIRRDYQHKFSWNTVFVSLYTTLLSPFVTKFLLKLKLTPNKMTVLMIISGILGGISFAIPGIAYKIIGLIFIHLWFILDCSDGEAARITKRFSKFGTEIDYAAHVIDHPVILFGFMCALCQADMGICNHIWIVLLFSVIAVYDLVFRSMATFGHIYNIKMSDLKNKTEVKSNSYKDVIRFFINILAHVPNLAVIFPIVYFISAKAAFYYSIAVAAMLVLYVPIVVISWLKRIVNI